MLHDVLAYVSSKKWQTVGREPTRTRAEKEVSARNECLLEAALATLRANRKTVRSVLCKNDHTIFPTNNQTRGVDALHTLLAHFRLATAPELAKLNEEFEAALVSSFTLWHPDITCRGADGLPFEPQRCAILREALHGLSAPAIVPFMTMPDKCGDTFKDVTVKAAWVYSNGERYAINYESTRLCIALADEAAGLFSGEYPASTYFVNCDFTIPAGTEQFCTVQMFAASCSGNSGGIVTVGTVSMA